jgi:hypothetical protein
MGIGKRLTGKDNFQRKQQTEEQTEEQTARHCAVRKRAAALSCAEFGAATFGTLPGDDVR